MLVCSRWEAAELLLLDQLTGYSARTVNSALSSGNPTMSQAGFRVTLQNHPYLSSAEVKLAELTGRADAAEEKETPRHRLAYVWKSGIVTASTMSSTSVSRP